MYERNDVIRQFEKTIAKYCGAKFAVAVESCTAALFLSCLYCKVKEVTIPKRTYFSVPNSVIRAGGIVRWTDEKWQGAYRLKPYKIWDSACRLKRNMYKNGSFYCLSFQSAKLLPIGRGGMILTDNKKAANWFRLMRFDGRKEIPKEKDRVTLMGYNMYLTSEQAARGLDLYYWRLHGKKNLPDIKMSYTDLSKQPVWRKYEKRAKKY